MPRKKSPPILQRLCVEQLSSILFHLNKSKSFRNLPWSVDNRNPLVCLPDNLLQKLFSSLGKLANGNKFKIRIEILRYLFCRHFNEVDLSKIPYHKKDLADILSAIIPVATKIKKFIIGFTNIHLITYSQLADILNSKQLRTVMVDFVLSMASVTHLNFDYICFDEVLEAIGRNCPHLTILEISSRFITDDGLRYLCVNSSNERNPSSAKIQRIVLHPDAEGISAEGIRTLLENLPNLYEIEGFNVGRALEEIHRNNYKECKTVYPLKCFSYDKHLACNHSLLLDEILLRKCPYITCLDLKDPDDDELVSFGNFSLLRSITIKKSFNGKTTFEEGVFPLLRRVGRDLQELHLRMNKIDLNTIGYFCPTLQRLFCVTVDEILDLEWKAATPFECLEMLSIHCNSSATLSYLNIKNLLLHCHQLFYLAIFNAASLTEILFRDILSSNPLRKLRNLSLSYVEVSTKAIIELLISQNNELDLIVISLLWR